MLQQTNGKLRTYIAFKSNFDREKYLSVLKSFEQRRCLTQIRISCHQLKIEAGRYQGTLLQDRKCERCSGTMLKVLLYADLLVSRAKKRAMLFHVL
jgi:hypothetical protein